MKILVLATTFPRWEKDTEPSFVYNLSDWVGRCGHEVTVLVPHAPGAKIQEKMGKLNVFRFRYLWPESLEKVCYNGGALDNLKNSWIAKFGLPFLLVSQLFNIYRLVKNNKFDLIHSHWLIPQGFFAAVIKKMFNIPLVVTAHAGDIFTVRSPILRQTVKFVLSNCDACTVVSNGTRIAVENVYQPKKLELIPMGVDLTSFSPTNKDFSIKKNLGLIESDPMVLAIGRFAEKKGFKYLLKALPSVVQEFPNLKLVIVGFGPEEERLKQLTRELNLEPNVVFLGKIPNQELPKYYASADVFVCPSIIDSRGDTEGLPVVLMESLASKCPVVASDVGGISDAIINDETGFLIEEKRPDILADKILTLLKDYELRDKLTTYGQIYAHEKFSWDGVSKRFLKIFESICSDK